MQRNQATYPQAGTSSSNLTTSALLAGLSLLCLAPRGFHVCYIREDTAVPERVDLASGSVSTILKPCHKFRISFDARGPRDDIKVGATRRCCCRHQGRRMIQIVMRGCTVALFGGWLQLGDGDDSCCPSCWQGLKGRQSNLYASHLLALRTAPAAAAMLLLLSQALEIAARMAESSANLQKDIRISHSVIPDHFEQEDDGVDDGFPQSRGADRVAEFTGS